MKKDILLLLILLFFFSCKDDSEKDANPNLVINEKGIAGIWDSEMGTLIYYDSLKSNVYEVPVVVGLSDYKFTENTVQAMDGSGSVYSGTFKLSNPDNKNYIIISFKEKGDVTFEITFLSKKTMVWQQPYPVLKYSRTENEDENRNGDAYEMLTLYAKSVTFRQQFIKR
ncbi:hypothetical protein AAE02nite_28870 [Adhaeribacter aerolatus]|uniref:Uncharacterized protein n=1 Tax=Adhaeribacter aerolatus TaxID=670289 RepID=A0A512AZS9_9BACT|nr:hypothetical protein [Adhaeribacter aerolatus]GEO05223.1 hypothetical protein AAE02nite_28870 [Adhaeribacter aerolatus]